MNWLNRLLLIEDKHHEVITRLAQLRAEKARLLGYANFAAFALDDQMAKTPETALKLMRRAASFLERGGGARRTQRLVGAPLEDDEQPAGVAVGQRDQPRGRGQVVRQGLVGDDEQPGPQPGRRRRLPSRWRSTLRTSHE